MSSPPKRILFTQKFASLGGSQQSLIYQLELMDRTRYEPLVLVSNQGWLTEQLDALGIRWQLERFGRWSNLKALPGNLALIVRLARLIKRENIDLVHANEHWVAPPCLLAARLASRPCICHFRTGLEDLTPSRVKKYLYAKYDAVLPVAEVLRAAMARSLSTDAHLTVVRDGVPKPRSQPTDHSARNERILINVGAIYAVKGQAIILDCAIPWLKNNPHGKLWFVGGTRENDDYLDKMKQRVAAEGLSEQVIFHGIRRDVPELLDQADALVAYSTVEGIPRVVMEAMAAARPVLVSNTPGMSEVVSDGTVGRVLDFHADTNPLPKALDQLFNNPSALKQMAMQAQSWALANVSTQAMTDQIVAIYDQLLEKQA